MASNCLIHRDSKGNIIKVDNPNTGLESKVLNKIAKLPHIESLEQAVKIYDEVLKANPQDKLDGFVSNAIAAITNLKDKNNKNIKGWINQLTDVQKNGGIRNVKQELDWIGLEDYLNEWITENKPKNGNVPLSVIEDYVKSNQIEIVEVSKGFQKIVRNSDRKISPFTETVINNLIIRSDSIKEVKSKISQNIKNYKALSKRPIGSDYGYGNIMTKDKQQEFEIIIKELELELVFSDFKQNNSSTKYSEYQLEGGDNYREILLTLPNTNKSVVELSKQYNQVLLERDKLPYGSDERLDKSQQLEQINKALEQSKKQSKNYQSSHWDESNILAHIRLNERTLPNGERVLMVEEIQADVGKDTKDTQDKFLKEIDKSFDNVLDQLIKEGVIEEEC